MADQNYPVYPGTALRVGSGGSDVKTMQQYLNGIGVVYNGINRLTVDSKFGHDTQKAVIRFQKQFNLAHDGVIGKDTWNKIVAVYLSVADYKPLDVKTKYPGLMVKGASGDSVRFLQSYLNTIKKKKSLSWPTTTVDGIFGSNTQAAVSGFQYAYNLTADGKVGSNTWSKLIPEFNTLIKT